MTACLPIVNVAVGVLINEQRCLLLTQRPLNKPQAGFWEFPGGKIEKNESPLQALIRELEEELNIKPDLAHTTFLGTLEHAYSDYFLKATVFLVAFWQGSLKGLENQELQWIATSTATPHPLLASCEEVFNLLYQKTDLFTETLLD